MVLARMVARNSDAKFEAKDMILSGDRAVVGWVYRNISVGFATSLVPPL